MVFFSQLANVFAIQLQFYFHDNWEFREQAPSTFSPANSFLGVPNVYQHLAPHSIRISKISSLKPISPFRSLYYSETLEILRNWYRKPRSKTDDDWPDLCNHFYPSSYFPFYLLSQTFCAWFSQSVGGLRCQSVLSTVASPASRGPEAAGWRKGGGGAGGQKIDLLLSQTLSFPFTNCVKHNQVVRLHTTQLILLYSCNWASQVHNHRNTLLWSLVVGGDYISQSC